MDISTLSNHISHLGKNYFDVACQIVLTDVFNMQAINVDGKNDGGTDFSVITRDGTRTLVAYQVTIQKNDIIRKAYKDAKKAVEKLGVKKFFFFTTQILSETEKRSLDNKISDELNIQSSCFDAITVAGFLIECGKYVDFLNATGENWPSNGKISINYPEAFLHACTLETPDTRELKFGAYDDTILFVICNHSQGVSEDAIVAKSLETLSQNNDEHIISSRISSLLSKGLIVKKNNLFELSEKSKNDIISRQELYKRELGNLVSAQVDLFHSHNVNWNTDDCLKISGWLVSASIHSQLKNLKDIKATMTTHPVFTNFDSNALSKLRIFMIKDKKLPLSELSSVEDDLLDMASKHPLIVKMTRAAMFVALNGQTPIHSARALGISSWADFNLILEPTVAIPLICSQLYNGFVNKRFNNSIKAIERAKKYDISLYIPFFYIRECAGHLLEAYKYSQVKFTQDELVELQFSNNAYIANYYALKNMGARVPEDLIDYLSTFSKTIKIPRSDVNTWTREVMTDIQSILSKENIAYIDTPKYSSENCKEIQIEYMNIAKTKSQYLLDHDVWALKLTNDHITKENQHWGIMTYDKTLINMGKNDFYKGWICTPSKFLDITEVHQPLAEAKFNSLLHTFATFSEKTLSAGARIIDRLIMLASEKMMSWEFKDLVEKFKNDLLTSMDYDDPNYQSKIDEKVKEFLKEQKIDETFPEDVEIADTED